MLKKYGVESLLLLKKRLDSMGVTWFLAYGTLVGAVKEKGFLLNDTDIDIGIVENENSMKNVEALREDGFVLRKRFLVDGGEFAKEETYEFRGIPIDLFYFRKSPEGLLGYVFVEIDNKLLPKETHFHFCQIETIEIFGDKFPVPSPPEIFLQTHYGKNFMKEDNSWRNGGPLGDSRIVKKEVEYLEYGV